MMSHYTYRTLIDMVLLVQLFDRIEMLRTFIYFAQQFVRIFKYKNITNIWETQILYFFEVVV